MHLSERLKQVKPSMTMAITAKAEALRKQGQDVIGLGAGEPDFDTPKHICDAASRAIYQGYTRYTSADGMLELRQQIVTKLRDQNQLNYSADEVVVTVGAKQGIYNICQALLNAADEVIIPAPYWVSYPDMVKLAEAIPVIVQCQQQNGFKITAEQLQQAITPRSRLLILNSPNNPTGRVYSQPELQAIAEVVRQYPQLVVVSDDIYEHIIFGDKPFKNLLNVAGDLHHQVIVVNGVSKAYAMTGWRIGYCAGDKTVISSIKKIQSQSTSNPCSISQMAAIEALQGPQDFIAEMRQTFNQRNQLISDQLRQVPGVDVAAAEGAFYLYANIQELMAAKGFDSDIDFAAALLDQAQVAVVPGSPFGTNGYMRISFAAALDKLHQAVDRIDQFARC